MVPYGHRAGDRLQHEKNNRSAIGEKRRSAFHAKVASTVDPLVSSICHHSNVD